ncbi:hypothetical protein PRIC1_004259 [Phytophthora ramorum]
MAARSPLQQRSSESSISDRDRTRTSSGSTRVHLARRLTGQVHVGSMEVPPDVVGIDKGMVTVAVKVRPLTLDSERNGGGGLHTWQEWRAVQKLLSTVHEPTDRSVLEGRRYLIRYYATSVESESFRLIMEFCPHRDLFSELESRGALGPEPRERVPQQEARRWVLQLAKGLRYLHEKKIAHRDLSRRLGSMKEVLEHPAMLATARTERSLIAVER